MAEIPGTQNSTNDSGQLVGRIVMAVILGEAIWALLISLTHDLAVPALAQLMGGDPKSPLYLGDGTIHAGGIFAAVLQVCLAGIVAIILNSYVNRGPRVVRVVTRVIPAAAVPVPVKSVTPVPQPPPVPASQPLAAPPAAPMASAPVSRPLPPPGPAAPMVQPPPPAVIQPAPVAKAPTPPAALPAPAKPAKPKKIYYNIVGEPVESDD